MVKKRVKVFPISLLPEEEMPPVRKISVARVRKRDGRLVKFNQKKIAAAIRKAIKAVGEDDRNLAEKLSDKVAGILEEDYDGFAIPTVEEIQDVVERVLIEAGQVEVAKAYILYRDLHARSRDIHSLVDSDELMGKYLDQLDWRVKENSNMGYSLQGLNNHVASVASANYWLNKIYPAPIREAHASGDLHIHDLQQLSAYCCGWDLQDFLAKGIVGVSGKIQSGPPKHLRTALGQLVNLFYTLQGETAGAQAVSSFDTYLAPFIYYDRLTYKQVKQALQEFIFNMNVPTRVGFQCVSEDTEILTPQGWKKYNEVKKGGVIKTFNLKTGKIEDQKVTGVFKKNYKGKMYRLKNRIQDQLVSPGHKVVRKKFNSDRYVLEPIEDVLKLKSPFLIPVAGGNANKEGKFDDEQIKLMAWIISEGTIERPSQYRGCFRVSIYQSKIRNEKNYNEIISLLKHFRLKYAVTKTASLGADVQQVRLNAESSRQVHRWFGTRENVHFIPDYLLNLSERQSNLFLETYLKADGFEGCKISTADPGLLDDLQTLIVNSGYGFTVSKREPTIGKKEIYVLRIIKHKETYIPRVETLDYKGVIWCPHTKNGTIVARRKGKVFITGNTPFTNVTLDFKPSGTLAKEVVVVGGKPKNKVYGDFEKEMKMFNRAFAEVMLAGDAKGRVFTFPIPTYNITTDFVWDNPDFELIWEMARKYGLPYFSNFVNSDMSPEDARSMCCRLRLDNRELRKRGGGLFGANPLTGSIGVVTLNLPRLGYQSENKKEFFASLAGLMDLAKESLLLKREMIEKFTEGGLYPYSRVYLETVKQRFKRYWQNHFSTIGIIGMNEACLNLLGEDITSKKGKAFALEAMDFMRGRIGNYQKETNQLFNLEATPAEGTSYRFARADKERYPKIMVANEEACQNDQADPYYTNSTHLPVGFTDDLFEALDHQDQLQAKYTGGTVLHGFLGESLSNTAGLKNLVKKLVNRYRLPYFTLTPTFSICPNHGYLAGEHHLCPKCEGETLCEVYSRVVGYLRPVNQWNLGKKAEFFDRKTYNQQLHLGKAKANGH